MDSFSVDSLKIGDYIIIGTREGDEYGQHYTSAM